MKHSACRRALLEGDLNPEIAEHLDECDACRHFSEDLALVATRAAELAPGPAPEGLADRVLAHVWAADGSEATSKAPAAVPADVDLGGGGDDGVVVDLTSVDRTARRRPTFTALHRPLLATTSIAAVLILLIGVLAVLPARDSSDGTTTNPVLVAAERTAESGTARIRVSGSVSVETDLGNRLPDLPTFELERLPELPDPPHFEPPPTPDLSHLPPEYRAEAEAEIAASIEAARQRHDDYIRRSQERIAELRADAAAALERARDQIPDRFSAEAEISGDGEVVFGEALRVDGSVDLVSSNAGPDTSAAGSFRLVVQGSEARYLGPEGQWIAVPGPAGPLGTLMLDPSGVTRLLNDARTGVEDLGEDEIDGRRVRGYRFGVGSSVLAGVDDGADGTAEAWVDVEDEVLLRLTIRSTVRHDEGPRRGVLRTTLTMDLTDFGADVSVDVPPAQGRASSPLGPAAILYPFDAGFSVSFYAGIEVPEVPELPAIPEIDVEVPEIPEVPQIPPPPPPPSPEFQEPQYQEPEYEAPQYQEPEFEEPRYDEQYGSSGGAGF